MHAASTWPPLYHLLGLVNGYGEGVGVEDEIGVRVGVGVRVRVLWGLEGRDEGLG